MKMSSVILLAGVWLSCVVADTWAELRVGATVTDVTPAQLPVIVNGGILGRTVDGVKTPLSARAIVLDDGPVRLGIVIVDSCVLPRPFLDEVKPRTGPSRMGCYKSRKIYRLETMDPSPRPNR